MDGLTVTAALRREDPAAFELLTRTPQPFRFADSESGLRAAEPLIGLSTDGDVVAVRYNNRSAAPLDLPPAQVEVYYAAYRRLSAPYRAPEVAVRVRLEPGDLLVTVNTRVLHGREAFEVASGHRHISAYTGVLGRPRRSG